MSSLLCPARFAALILAVLGHVLAVPAAVTVSEKDLVLPTYLAGAPEPNPIFYFGRQSQGAEGRVYPYPLYDSLTHIKSNKTYHLIYLENEYIRVGVLPEIGGRLFEAVDKSNNYDFIYRQHVIKPALIGLIGAWISGGIEWNIPHHHRATTFLPVQHRVEANRDGSKTVWVGELEVRHRTRWAVGYTLAPGKSYLTAKIRIVNGTPFSNTMLCFANAAVHANHDYQIIFPPDTRYVTFHHKNDFTTWPIATGRYAGADFGQGTDVSWFVNHTNANSMFAWNYTADFFAGYDHGKQAGTMSVADHHIVPGKKFWTWGSGPRGRMWDKILTDNDGPYIELMTGGYSDNQPDYSWLQPFETKSFDMHWYPFRDIGGVKNANLDAAVNLEVTNALATVGFHTTAAHRGARAVLKVGDQVLLDEKIAINPAKPFVREVPVPPGTDAYALRAALFVNGAELIAYSPVRLDPVPRPETIKNPPAPAEIKTVEELYLAGRRIEQFHDPGREPEPYWEEALRRDPGDARVNQALGIRHLKQARFSEAEQHLRTAIDRLTVKYTTPKEGEPFYCLGLALKAQGKFDEAFDFFYKATWSEAWRSPAYFALAEIATRRGDIADALSYVDRSLAANAWNIRALTLKAALHRQTGDKQQARAALDAARVVDPLDVRVMAERWLGGERRGVVGLTETLREHPATGLEVAAEYGNAGLWRDGAAILNQAVNAAPDKERVSPLAYYYLGHFAERLGDINQAKDYRRLAAEAEPDYVFPFQWEAIHVLRRAIELNPQDARAPYYLGNLLYDWQPAEATRWWERSVALEPSFAIAHRNLALAYLHQKPLGDTNRAVAHFERAVSAPRKYALHFAKLDELYAQVGKAPAERLALLEQNHEVVAQRDDSLSRAIGMKVFAGKQDQAIALMTGRKFSVWEGGSLDVADHWVNAHLLRGQERVAAKQYADALADFRSAATIPDNLPSDRGTARGHEPELAYWTGIAQEALGQADLAKQSWQQAAAVSASPRSRRNAETGNRLSEQTVQVYYQGLARRKLGQEEEAKLMFQELVETGRRALQPGADRADGTAASLESMTRPQQALAHCVMGLGHLGLGEWTKAKAELETAMRAMPDLLPGKINLRNAN